MTKGDKEKEAFEWMARAGYAARGVVFLIVGALAILAAFSGGRAEGSRGALQSVLTQPFGQVLLGVVALGLLCFAGWRVLQSVFDADHYGSNAEGVRRRLAFGGGALIHLGLAAWAASLALGFARASDDDKAVRDWTAWLLAQPLGRWLTLAIGVGIAAFGVALAVKATKAEFRKRLEVSAEKRRWIVALGRFGFLARAVLFVLVGVFLVIAALRFNAGEAAGLGGALRVLQTQSYGWILLSITALGLAAFGSFELAQAACRRVDCPSVREAAAKLDLQPI